MERSKKQKAFQQAQRSQQASKPKADKAQKKFQQAQQNQSQSVNRHDSRSTKVDQISPRQTGLMSLEANMTSPSTIEVTINYIGAAADMNFGQAIDKVVIHVAQQDPSYFFSTSVTPEPQKWPVMVKAYLMWAYFSRFVDVGRTTGTWIRTMPKFPEDYHLPEAMARLLIYVGEYNFAGARYIPALAAIDTVPLLGHRQLANTATGIAATNFVQDFVGNWLVDTGSQETYLEAALGLIGNDFTSVYTYASYINDWIASLGGSVKYSELKPQAIDGSLYASIVSTSTLSTAFVNEDYSAEVALLISNRATTASVFPVSKTPYFPWFVPTNAGTDFISNLYDQNARSVIYVFSHMKYFNSYEFDYAGVKIKRCAVNYMPLSYGTLESTLQASAAKIFAYEGIQSADATQIMFALYAICQGLYARRTSDVGFASVGKYWQRYVPPNSFRGVKVPIPIANAIQEVGPLVRDGQLNVPVIDQVGSLGAMSSTVTSSAQHDIWSKFLIGISGANNITMTSYFAYGTYGCLASTFTIGSWILNAAWLTSTFSANGAKRMFIPNLLMGLFVQYLDKVTDAINAGDVFQSISSMPFGGACMMTVQYLKWDTTTTQPYMYDTLLGNYTVYGTNNVVAIGTFLPVGDRDLLCSYLGITQVVRTESDFQNLPFKHRKGGIGFNQVAFVDQQMTGIIGPGSSFMLSLAETKRKNHIENIRIGTLSSSVNDPNQCKSWWCSAYDAAMSGLSKALDGARSVNMEPRDVANLLRESAQVVYQVYKGDMIGVATSIGKKLLSPGSRPHAMIEYEL